MKANDLLKSTAAPLMAVAANIIVLYIVYSIARIEFLLENISYFGGLTGSGRLWRVLWGGIVMDTPAIFYTNALWILMLLLPLHFKERRTYQKVCKWIFIVINTVALIANLADSVYFPFTMRRTTADFFSEFSNEGNIGLIFLTELGRHWYLVLLAAALVWGMWKLYVMPAVSLTRNALPRYYIISVISLAIAAVTTVSGIRGGLLNHWWQYLIALPLIFIAWRTWRDGLFTTGKKLLCGLSAAAALLLICTAPVGGWRHRDIRPISLSNASAFTANPLESALVLNTPFSMIRSIGKTPFADPGYYASAEEAEKIFTPMHAAASDSVPVRRKNVVIIIIESFGREYEGTLNRYLFGESYPSLTEFTDSLAQHSAWWEYSFCNGRKSIDAMPSILAGIPMFVKPFVLTPSALDKIEGIPAHLAREGYQTAFFHGARTGSMGFDAFARSIGFGEYYGREDFNRDRRFGGDSDFDGYWAIWDEPFLQYYALKMSDMRQPFMTAVFTASSHHPFNIPDSYKAKYKEGNKPIYKCIRYTDNALRRFFDTARRQPWFKNTIFVITSDHTNQGERPEFRSGIGGFWSPVIIYDPSGDIKPGRRDGVAQQTDIMPTILSHLGYRHPYLSFGKDLEATPATDTWAVNYINGTYQYVRHGLVMQFDGRKVTGLYRLGDWLMKRDLKGKEPRQAQMERELKAIIQSYMVRLREDRLAP